MPKKQSCLGLTLMSGMALAMIADYFLVRHHVSSEGLQYGKLFGPRGAVRWINVRSVRYAPIMKRFMKSSNLETTSAATVRLSAMLMGLPTFAQQVLADVPTDRLDEPTSSLLHETARGNLPSV